MNKQNKGFAIRCLRATQNGFVTETLNKNSEWTIATSSAGFDSLAQARQFFAGSSHALRGSSIWIEGPRGGRYGTMTRGES